jgi:hypothetical protein
MSIASLDGRQREMFVGNFRDAGRSGTGAEPATIRAKGESQLTR